MDLSVIIASLHGKALEQEHGLNQLFIQYKNLRRMVVTRNKCVKLILYKSLVMQRLEY